MSSDTILDELKEIEVPTVEQFDRLFLWLNNHYDQYVTFETQIFSKVMLRRSRAPRRGTEVLDYDIVQIGIAREKDQKKGHATKLFENMTTAAIRHGRGILLEQCCTPGSQKLGARIVRDGLAVGFNPSPFYETGFESFLSALQG
jgi:hypothetical protein